MKVLVCVKRVLDPQVKARVKSDGSGVDLSNAKMTMNPFCENALEEALRLREAGSADEVVVVSVGLPLLCVVVCVVGGGWCSACGCRCCCGRRC